MLKKILKKEGILIIHRHKKQNDIFPKSIEIIEQKNYWNFKNYIWRLF